MYILYNKLDCARRVIVPGKFSMSPLYALGISLSNDVCHSTSIGSRLRFRRRFACTLFTFKRAQWPGALHHGRVASRRCPYENSIKQHCRDSDVFPRVDGNPWGTGWEWGWGGGWSDSGVFERQIFTARTAANEPAPVKRSSPTTERRFYLFYAAIGTKNLPPL